MNKILSLSVFCFLLSIKYTQGQIVNGCGFMQGQFCEVGVATNGSYGTPQDAPAGYHARPGSNPFFYNPVSATQVSRPGALGFVCDAGKDGWAVGAPTYIGDYFLPGYPQEGYSIDVAGVNHDAFCSIYSTFGTTGFTGGMTGSVTGQTATATVITNTFQGAIGALNVTQKTYLKLNKTYFVGEVKFVNTGAVPLNDIYYLRTLDPDQEQPVGGGFTTTNTIVNTLPNPAHKSLVTAVGTTYSSYLGLASKDCRAKPFIFTGGLTPTAALAPIYNELAGTQYKYTGTFVQDCAIGMVYKIGLLNPGDSTTVKFAYVLSAADVDSAFIDVGAGIGFNGNNYNTHDTIPVCQNATHPFNITNPENYIWTWYPSTFLGSPTGSTNTVTIGTTPLTYMAVSNNTCADTIWVTFNPVPPPPPFIIYDTICQGDTYTFLGNTFTTSTIYTDTLASIANCDSIVELRLTVLQVVIPAFSMTPAPLCGLDTTVLTYSGIYDPGYTYNWGGFDGANVISSAGPVGPFTLNWSTPGIKTIKLIVTSKGCTDSLTKTIEVKPDPLVTLTGPDSICFNFNAVVTSTVAVPSSTMLWTLDNANVLAGNPTVDGTLTLSWPTLGNKKITFSAELNGCYNIATHFVEVNPLPVADAKMIADHNPVCQYDIVKITATDQPNSFYEWNSSSFPSTKFVREFDLQTDESTVHISLKVTNDHGCVDYDSLVVAPEECAPLFIPNIFSPNGDGKNDYFNVVIKGQLRSKEISVYNRWGNQLYFSQDKNSKGWDGTFKGKECDTDVYFYLIRVETAKDGYKVYKGEFTLIR